MAVAKAYGVRKIIAFDIEQSRVDFAVKYAANIGVVCPLKEQSADPLAFAKEFIEKVMKEHRLGSGVDLAIEASGAESCVQMAVVITKSGGTSKLAIVVEYGRYVLTIEQVIQAGLGKQLTSVPLHLFTAKDLTMKGNRLLTSQMPTRDVNRD